MDVQLTNLSSSVTHSQQESQTKVAPQMPEKTGKALPASGTNEPPKPQKLQKAVQQIKSFLSQSQRQLQFQVDKQSGRTIITVINSLTGETIRQIPEEYVLKLAAEMRHNGPGFINETV